MNILDPLYNENGNENGEKKVLACSRDNPDCEACGS